ncbi:MAG: S9 family peptidase, partial [Candidatus Competibacteraceae bacterium]|nr:S9 family peptidase [Candidatus Competibacteraceae bacterium]
MTTAKIAPYGSWKSPITSDLIVAGTIGFGHLVLEGDDSYWIESRPTEGGRNVIVRRSPDGTVADITPSPYSARTRVHEMGGGAFFVHQGVVFFANDADQRLYRQDPGRDPRPLTADGAHRFADGLVDSHHNRIVIVLEDHSQDGREPVNLLVSLDPQDGESRMVLASGQDFYSSPRVSPDGSRLAWLSWNHPNMPWDGTELWVADLNPDGSVANPRAVAGGPNESIFQPEWSPDGALFFVSDRSGWWNLFRWDGEGDGRPLLPMEAEFGQPQWLFGMSTYAFESPERLVCAYRWRGSWHLATLDPDGQHLAVVRLPYSEYEQIRARPGRVVCLAASPLEFTALVELDLDSRQTTVLRRSSQLELDAGYLSAPEPVEYPSGDHTAHAYYYAPLNRDYQAPGQDKPPLMVRSHGGPTGSTDGRLNLSIQYWTSRGCGVLDVNSGGSTGDGRDYRKLREGNWGVVD